MRASGLKTFWSLGQWQEHMDDLYSDVNSRREPLETFARLTEMAAGTARGVREEDEELIQKYPPRFMAWLLGLSNQLDIDLEQATFDYYPGVCTYCRKSSNCACSVTDEKNERISDEEDIIRLKQKREKPSNLDEWVGMFNKIYGNVNEKIGEEDLLFHLLEELGEVCEIVRHYTITDEKLEEWSDQVTPDDIETRLRQEISDLFAWYCGLSNIMGVQVDHRMKMTYEESCPQCNKKPCSCDPYRIHEKVRL